MMLTLSALLLSAPATGMGPAPANGGVPQPVAQVNVTSYLGRWFQTYASFNVKYTFELGGNCVTADYGATETANVISVRNTVRPRWWSDIKVNGFAAQSTDADVVGALSVDFGGGFFGNADASQAAFSPPGNYWIIALGPEVDGLYDWAVVSDSKQSQLYVLTRNVARFRSSYEAAILADLKTWGFT